MPRGGARPGAGRKPTVMLQGAKPPEKPLTPKTDPAGIVTASLDEVSATPDSPLGYLKTVYTDPEIDVRVRVRAAIGAAQYLHTKLHDGGKKDAVQAKAERAAGGKFAAAAPPLKLVQP